MIAHRLFMIAVAAAALVASTGSAGAAEKAGTPNLTELKDAVTTANKRGQNVDDIRAALTAFEKAMVKAEIKPGEAPAELTALREAVELAAKKGENVEAISKELGVIEKTLTGHAYERPKPVEPKPEEVPSFTPPFPRRGGVGIGGKGGNPWAGGARGGVVIGPGGGGFTTTSITISNGNFTIRARQGDVNYLVTGSLNGNEAPKIVIQDGEKKIETDDLKKVPEDYRPAAEQLLKKVTRQP